MLSERQLEAILDVYRQRMQKVVESYLKRMGEHLRDIGKLTQSDIDRLVELKRVNYNMRQIKREIASAANVPLSDIDKVFAAVAESDVKFANEVFASDLTPRIKDNPTLERILKAQAKITQQTLDNLSQTTILSDGYRNAVDLAVQTVQIGVIDYQSAIRSALKSAAIEGLRVQYPSGLTRRLDSAIRMNILDGIRAVNQDIMRQVGKEFRADGIEISAHALCAEDHLPYQGTQMSEKEFDRLQNRLDRPFGIWNCRHNWWPIILGVSQPAYTQEELDAYKRNSTEQITIDGVTKTRYQWSQEQRRIETAVRYQKDIAIAAKASNDDLLRRTTQRNINKLQANYAKISEKAGLIPDKNRMAVAGFRKVKTADELKNPAKYGIMNLKINANGEVVNPMNSERYNTIKTGMAKIGITIMEAKGDDLRYLRYGLGAEATYSHGYIMHIGKIPSASGLFEEIIHSTQARKYGELESTDIVELSAREVAANRMLLKHGKAYGFDKIDFEDIKNNLLYWEKRYRKETGYSYDDGNHNRQI